MQDIESSMSEGKKKDLTSSLESIKYKSNNFDLFIFRFTNIDSENVEVFCKQHSKILSSKFKKQKNIVIGYDFTTLETLDLKFLDIIQKQHEQFEEEYKSIVICVYCLVMNDILVNSANFILKMCEPVVPVFIGTDLRNVEASVKKTIDNK